MSKAEKRLLAAANEMQAIARGEAEPVRTHPAPSSYALAQALYDCASSSRSPSLRPGESLRRSPSRRP